jgi:hypothetical protein
MFGAPRVLVAALLLALGFAANNASPVNMYVDKKVRGVYYMAHVQFHSTTSTTASFTTSTVLPDTINKDSQHCPHDICTLGPRLSPSCDSCAARIIDDDPYCGEINWSYICVRKVSSICNIDCVSANSLV